MALVVVEQDLGAPPRAPAPGTATCLVDLGLACNLACAGCAERRDGAPLDARETRELADQVLRHAAAQRATTLGVVLFGGEPLLQLELLARLSSRLRRACDADAIDYRGHLLTNGTLLDVARARRLAEAGLSRVQVTLDGPRGAHDRRHRTRGGDATWRTIVDHLKAAREELEVVVRANAAAPGPGVELLLEVLEHEGLFSGPSPVTVFVARPAPYRRQARDLLRLFAALDEARRAAPRRAPAWPRDGASAPP